MLQKAHRLRGDLHCWDWYPCFFRVLSASYCKTFLTDSSSYTKFYLSDWHFPYQMLMTGLILDGGLLISKNRWLEWRSYFTNVKEKKNSDLFKKLQQVLCFRGTWILIREERKDSFCVTCWFLTYLWKPREVISLCKNCNLHSFSRDLTELLKKEKGKKRKKKAAF